MNAWCGVSKAIVTDIPGTTRDVIEAGKVSSWTSHHLHECITWSDLSIDGVPVTLLDTAGIHEGSDTVEKIGIERASSTARGADLIVMVMDVSEGWTDGDAAVFQSLWGDGSHIRPPAILAANKTDKTGPYASPLRPVHPHSNAL